jgi:hypothetical protein
MLHICSLPSGWCTICRQRNPRRGSPIQVTLHVRLGGWYTIAQPETPQVERLQAPSSNCLVQCMRPSASAGSALPLARHLIRPLPSNRYVYLRRRVAVPLA